MIQIKNVSKQFGAKTILKHINLAIPKGSIFGIIGLSGAGKTTLLRCLDLLEDVTDGTILFEGVEIQHLNKVNRSAYQQKVGMIFQHFNLLASKSVYDNIALPLKLQKYPKAEIARRVHEVITFVGLEEHINKYPHELSGGQKQRVGIARALVHQPKLLLCDEATSALDPETSMKILALLKRVNEIYGITIVLITHQMEVIREICTEVALMEQGEIVEKGTVFEVFTRPQTTTATRFVETVLQREFPEKIAQSIQEKKTPCYRLTFTKGHTQEPVLSKITQDANVHFSILFGTLTEIQQQFFGQLTVEFFGKTEAIQTVIEQLAAYGIIAEKIVKEEQA